VESIRSAGSGAGGREVPPGCRGAGPHPWAHSDPPEAAQGGLATHGRSRGGGAPTYSAEDGHGSGR